jgi:hypothetical protein
VGAQRIRGGRGLELLLRARRRRGVPVPDRFHSHREEELEAAPVASPGSAAARAVRGGAARGQRGERERADEPRGIGRVGLPRVLEPLRGAREVAGTEQRRTESARKRARSRFRSAPVGSFWLARRKCSTASLAARRARSRRPIEVCTAKSVRP